jgi:MFS superfamily sulfate permease-like transporter
MSTLQLLMAVLHLSFISAYLSDQVIGGFTTGAAVHVLASQLNKVIDVKIDNYGGLFKLYYVRKYLCQF